MPKYDYVALDNRGKETKGTVEVASQNEAIGRVKEMGLFPTKIVETEKAQDKKFSPKKARSAARPGAGRGRRPTTPSTTSRPPPSSRRSTTKRPLNEQ